METEIEFMFTDKGVYCIARNNRFPVGSAFLMFYGTKQAEIVGLMVLEQYRKQGIGSTIVNRILELKEELDLEEISMTTNSEIVKKIAKKFNFVSWTKWVLR